MTALGAGMGTGVKLHLVPGTTLKALSWRPPGLALKAGTRSVDAFNQVPSGPFVLFLLALLYVGV